ncbi:hypothetical protein MHYP_G00238190 [Metynnis hypsauchen]
MAQAGVFLEQDQFNCSICLDVLKDPVTVPCGHSYCKGCIKGYWDQDDYLGIYGCPQCRQSFAPRPVLGRNTMLADVVDRLKKTGLGSSSALSEAPMSEPTVAEPGDVECDVCTGRKNKAFRSCLVCLASYCETHLKPHYESPAFQKHRLTSPSNKLQDSLCSRHDKLLEVFCRTDQHCICYLCLTDEHKGHDTVLASAEMTEKKNALAEMQRNSQQKIQEREKELQDLRQATQSLTLSAQAALEESERIFTELVCSIERRRTEVKELIRVQERAATAQAEELLRQLEREIAELKKRDTELGQLVQTEDHISFLQNYRSACTQPVTMDIPGITVDPGFGCAMSAVSEFQALLEDVCQGGFVNISEKVKDVTIIQNTKPKVDTEPNAALPPVAPLTFPVTPIFQNIDSQNTFGVAAPTFSGFTFASFASRPSGTRLRTQQRRRRSHFLHIFLSLPCKADPSTCCISTPVAVAHPFPVLILPVIGCCWLFRAQPGSPFACTAVSHAQCVHKPYCLPPSAFFTLISLALATYQNGHNGHHTVAALEERTEKQRQLEEAFRRSKQRSKEKEKELKSIMKYLKRSAQAVEDDSERICTKLIRSIERRHCEVKELVRAEERAALAQAEGLLESLELQIEDHRRRENELEQLSHTEDHIHFLQKCKALSIPAELEELPCVDIHPYFSLIILRRALTELRERVNDVCDRELSRISDLIKDEQSESDETPPCVPVHTEIVSPAKSADQPQSEPKTRADFLQYCCELTLDQNTANSYLCLSEGNRKVCSYADYRPSENLPNCGLMEFQLIKNP